MRYPLPVPANPGGSANAVFFDNYPNGAPADVNGLKAQEAMRVRVSIFIDQAATFKVGWYAPGSTNERLVNGGGSGEAVTASTYFSRSIVILPGRTKIYLTTGSAPSTWEVGADRLDDQALAE